MSAEDFGLKRFSDYSEQQEAEITRLRAEVERLSTLILKAHGVLPENWVYTDSETTLDLLIAEIKSLRHKLGEWETPMTCGHPRALIAVEEEYHCYACQVIEPIKEENESLRKQIAEQPSRPDSLKPMDAWLDMDSFSEPWACDLVCYAQKLERHVAYLRGLLERARDHMNGDGFAFDLKQEIDRAMEKAE